VKKYLLDTNICIYIIKKKPLHVIQKLQSLDISDVAISSITLSELEYGVSKSAAVEKKTGINTISSSYRNDKSR